MPTRRPARSRAARSTEGRSGGRCGFHEVTKSHEEHETMSFIDTSCPSCTLRDFVMIRTGPCGGPPNLPARRVLEPPDFLRRQFSPFSGFQAGIPEGADRDAPQPNDRMGVLAYGVLQIEYRRAPRWIVPGRDVTPRLVE